MIGYDRVQGVGGSDGRQWRLQLFTDWGALPTELPPCEAPFLCLLASDTSGLNAEAIGEVALELLRRGCSHIVCWGPDCERVHDIFDEVHVMEHLDDQREVPALISTWFSGAPLEEALWFAVSTALSDQGAAEIRSVLAVCERREHWPEVVARTWDAPVAFMRETEG